MILILLRINLIRPKKRNLKLLDIDPDLYYIYQTLREQKNREGLSDFVSDLNKNKIHEELCRKSWIEKFKKVENRNVFDDFFKNLKTNHQEKYAKEIYGAFNKYPKNSFWMIRNYR